MKVQRLAPEARRAQLLALGATVFNARPYDDFSMDEIALAAGVSKGLLYHYFPTKREFYMASLRESCAEMLEVVSEAAGSGDPDRSLRAGLDAYLRFVEGHALAYRAVLRGGIGADPEVVAIADGFRDAVYGLVVRESRLAEVDAELALLIRGWIGFVEGASLAWVIKPEVGRDRLVELFGLELARLLEARGVIPESPAGGVAAAPVSASTPSPPPGRGGVEPGGRRPSDPPS